MGVSAGASCVLSSCLMVLVFTGMQIYRSFLTSSKMMTIFGGFLGSILFVLTLTAVGNLETKMFGHNFQTKLFPEVIFCLILALTASGMVHSVCITTCLIFSLISLYYVNRISQSKYVMSSAVSSMSSHKSRKNK
uniref:Uncharacterized protein n=1 Tax=Strigamia maritima TaxID=126957 RepID=T1IPA8_STRMM